MRRWSLGKTLVLIVAVNLLLGAALFTLRPPWRSTAAEVAPPPELPAQVLALQTSIAEGHHGEPYALDLSDADLTALVAYFLAVAPDIPFTRAKIAVTGDKIVVDAVTRGLAVTLPVRVTGALDAKDGLPQARVENISLGDTGLPGFVRDRVVSEVNASLDFSRYDMPMTVDSIVVRPGGVIVRGIVK